MLWRDYGASADAVRIKHGYDYAGNRVYREDTVAKGQGTPVYIDKYYTYDGLDELKNLDRGQLNGNKDAISGTPGKECQRAVKSSQVGGMKSSHFEHGEIRGRVSSTPYRLMETLSWRIDSIWRRFRR